MTEGVLDPLSLPCTRLNKCLQAYQSIQPVSAMFEDSSHHLWALKSAVGQRAFLKYAERTAAEKSIFWSWMQSLFCVSFPQAVSGYKEMYSLIEFLSGLKVPKVIECGANDVGGWVLSECLPGKPWRDEAVELDAAAFEKILASIERLYSGEGQESGGLIGDMLQPEISQRVWIEHLFNRLEESVEGYFEGVVWESIRQPLSDKVNIQEVGKLVPVMIDWRWDQFLIDGNEVALVDLDAWVWAPEILAWVIFELVWSERQLSALQQSFLQRNHSIPKIAPWRALYRFMLYKLEILGKVDLQEWMDRPTYFE
ncbi:hypothetical protein [Thiomicrorhabdus sp.]|uniref:hypothetical protein n=1 Tax=Thiomicrorhabdus sp. TaxID=2039724 RepID=UPI0029C954C0|nr:hypothetical protein [Thiomicrorhabdus sp.]